MKKIILTGGGTAGHVTPHLALLPALRKAEFEIQYIGSHNGIERGLAEKAGLTYHPIASGKLRRYLDVKNITDMFRVVKGLSDALRVLRRVKPALVFSKGGFVAVPVVMAARLLRIPTIIHESDFTSGLANRLAAPFAKKICVAFPETLKNISTKKAILTGIPIREELLKGSPTAGLKMCGFENNGKPILLVTGGSQGAAAINNAVREALPALTKKFRIIHLCGKGNLLNPLPNGNAPNTYAQFEYISDGLANLYAAADIVLSRAGAGTIFELLAMKKPHLLVPLSKNASRGDQILNAQSFQKQGYSAVLQEEDMNPATLTAEIDALYCRKNDYIKSMAQAQQTDGIAAVMDALLLHV
ncbi:MAG: undecaprenyldiphospho-muramoylpentapeptide beta-N-acetylglucosaminyltransferase [Defluviitaleaceae bacterium]|nr:undecaprenyldiphospho-muramoylpentapeptide beta-N-acetylglucosaminyltransferase [Defluviitaleaceae bacterium]MCL2276178.1 undecaprenyldiphospho-muramoylpentapeptide beta-N-acetylglucosaminyltransferase [Defluviitaleaceae bacterium]